MNNPIKLFDPNGLEARIALFRGAGGSSGCFSGCNTGMDKIAKNLNASFKASGTDARAKVFEHDEGAKAKGFLNEAGNDKKIVGGHSAGGGTAIDVANSGDIKGGLSLVVTVDAVMGVGTGRSQSTPGEEIGPVSNAGKVANFYQTGSATALQGAEAGVTIQGATNTEVQGVTHTTIDEKVAPEVEELIKDEMK